MNNALKNLGLVLLGTLLAAGCGGMAPEPTDLQEDMPPSSGGNPSEEPQQSLEVDPDPVTTEAACCYAKCSDQKWHGPFKTVTYGNCRNYAKYWCANHGKAYVGVKWDDC